MNPIEQLQADVFGYLRADDFFAHVNMVRVSEQQIQSDIESQKALFVNTSGKKGASIAVHLPSGHPVADNVEGPQLELRIEVFVTVRKLLNESATGTGIAEGALITRVLQDLHLLGLGACAVLTDSPAFEPFFKDSGIMVHRLVFRQQVNLPTVTRVARPAMSVDASVTLTCPTAGAAIHYTTDGTFPGLDATAYSAPFTKPATGTLLRVVAHKAGLAPSMITQRSIQ